MDYSDDPAARRAEWFRYYSEKRITHQWFQVHLLQDLPEVRSVLEVALLWNSVRRSECRSWRIKF